MHSVFVEPDQVQPVAPASDKSHSARRNATCRPSQVIEVGFATAATPG